MDQHNNGVNELKLYPEDTKISQSTILANAMDSLSEGLNEYEELRITDTTLIPPPVAIISINEEIISTPGNITTISGASKSGKSAFTNILLAGAISKDGILDGLAGIEVLPNIAGHAVLHFDTEQARHKHKSNLKSILSRCNINSCPSYFRSYNLRQRDIDEYLSITSNICSAACDQFGGIHLIVVDGIADYITDVNDTHQSNAIVKSFEELAIKYNTPVIVIVHTNPGSDKERGHLGSQCQRKSESVLIIKTDGDISYIEPKLLRMAGKGNIPLIQFIYDKNKGYHVWHGIKTGMNSAQGAGRIEVIRNLCSKVFRGQVSYQYNAALTAIMVENGKAITTAKGIFKEMHAHKMIIQGADNYWRLNDSPD